MTRPRWLKRVIPFRRGEKPQDSSELEQISASLDESARRIDEAERRINAALGIHVDVWKRNQ